MWKIIQEVLPALLIVLFISQYVIPIILDKKTWWLFRGNKEDKKMEIPTNTSPLSEEIKATKVVVDEAKTKAEIVKEKVKENLKTAEDLKKEADKLI